MKRTDRNFTATRNACKLCTPLGACMVFRGIKKAMPILHGSQGCSTYIRRYLISHFKEPIDIASSNFSEHATVFGGEASLCLSLENVIKQYDPAVIGVATTCLSETIGDDITMILQKYQEENKDKNLPLLVPVSTPSYIGTHIDGFHSAVKSIVMSLARDNYKGKHVNIFPGMVSPADIRYLKEILTDFRLEYVMLPDYSKTLDGSLWKEYQEIPEGGTPVSDIMKMGGAKANIEFGKVLEKKESAGKFLNNQFNITNYKLGLPIGINETDKLFNILEKISGGHTPDEHTEERGRLIDSYADGHKYVFESRAVIYGEEDLVIGIASFLSEIGVIPALCASGGESGFFKEKIRSLFPDFDEMNISVQDGVDFTEIEEETEKIKPDFVIGNSKGYSLTRRLNIPLIRIGFPIHDRFGAQRTLHLGYRGAQQLFDKIVNTIINKKQELSPVGYTYI